MGIRVVHTPVPESHSLFVMNKCIECSVFPKVSKTCFKIVHKIYAMSVSLKNRLDQMLCHALHRKEHGQT